MTAPRRLIAFALLAACAAFPAVALPLQATDEGGTGRTAWAPGQGSIARDRAVSAEDPRVAGTGAPQALGEGAGLQGDAAAEPKPSPSPAPKVWAVDFDGGPATASTPEEIKPYARLRATISGEPWLRWQVFGRADIDRTTDGNAFSIETFRTFASVEAIAGARYRINNSSVTVGAVGGVTWSRESDIKSPSDPRLWTAEGIVCLDRFTWWTDGGLACLGIGKRGPAGPGWATSVSITQPLKGAVSVAVDFDTPFVKLPDFIRALPGAVQAAAPLTNANTAPTPEQVAGVAQQLPIAIKVAVVVRLKSFRF